MRSDFRQAGKPIDISGMEAKLNEHSDLLRVLVGNTKPGKTYVPLADGRLMTIDGSRISYNKI